MFAKKQPPTVPPEPKLPPVLQISSPEDLAASIAEAEERLEPAYTEPEKVRNDRLAFSIITQAFHKGAEKISLTPDAKALEVQYLIAGEWRRQLRIPMHVVPGLGIAFKALAGLPVWEHRMALEGLVVVQYGAADYDVYLSITPTRYGEKIALRIEAV